MIPPLPQNPQICERAALELRKTRRYGWSGPELSGKFHRYRVFRHVPSIYKICPASAWRAAEQDGVYRGSADDLRDGFIHFSTAAQVGATARKHFSGQIDLLLIEVDADALGPALRWEQSRNDELFPHLYGTLEMGAVLSVRDLPAGSDNGFPEPPT